MFKRNTFVKRFTVLLLLAALMVPTVIFGVEAEDGSSQGGSVSILFTGDMHSHLEAQDGWGGFAKLKTTIDEVNQEYPDTFLLDAGDFSMGTPFQTIYMTQAAELRMMGQLGYDVTTLGNHEFDYRPAGLTKMLDTAASYQGTQSEYMQVTDPLTGSSSWEMVTYSLMPQIVQANIDWTKTLEDQDLSEDAAALKTAMDQYGVVDYTIVQQEGVRMAVFGLMGPEAISQAPEAGVLWEDYISRAKEIVSEIKENGEADLIVCLSHSGYYDAQGDDSEDIQLAEAVPDIDVIISGHSHDKLEEAITVGNTIVVGCGPYLNYAGHLVLTQGADGYEVTDYQLLPMDSTVEEDAATLAQVEEFKALVDEEYFSDFGMEYDQVLAGNDISFASVDEFGTVQQEEPLANLITDAFVYAAGKALGKDGDPVDVAVVPKGVVRASLSKGDVTVADAFNISSLGIGKDGVPGYPLVSVYLTGKELKNAAEVDATISEMIPEARLYFSGLAYTINSKRLFLNRATDVRLMNAKGEETKIQNNELYHVVADLYTCQMLGLVEEGSHGLLTITPKDADGNAITDFEDHIIYNGKTELKAWYAVASYIDALADNQIPTRYADVQGRKVVQDSMNPVALLKQPNHVGLMLLGILLIPVAIIVGLVVFFRSRRKKRRGYERSIFSSRTRGTGKPKMRIRRMKKNKYKY